MNRRNFYSDCGSKSGPPQVLARLTELRLHEIQVMANRAMRLPSTPSTSGSKCSRRPFLVAHYTDSRRRDGIAHVTGLDIENYLPALSCIH